jgi:hypothetical protein
MAECKVCEDTHEITIKRWVALGMPQMETTKPCPVCQKDKVRDLQYTGPR